MTPAAIHGDFSLERVYDAPRARVFAAWSDIEIKARWFGGPPDQWTALERKLDFRVGGTEIATGRFSSGTVSRFVARYHEIIPDQRLVYVYDMFVNDTFLSVSLVTVELVAAGAGTRMKFTEQAVFLDGDPKGLASRETGSAGLLDRMGQVLAGKL